MKDMFWTTTNAVGGCPSYNLWPHHSFTRYYRPKNIPSAEICAQKTLQICSLDIQFWTVGCGRYQRYSLLQNNPSENFVPQSQPKEKPRFQAYILFPNWLPPPTFLLDRCLRQRQYHPHHLWADNGNIILIISELGCIYYWVPLFCHFVLLAPDL